MVLFVFVLNNVKVLKMKSIIIKLWLRKELRNEKSIKNTNNSENGPVSVIILLYYCNSQISN